ncbi:MAG TPA: S1C family serine protease [Methylomirabilota bacterium]|nr:S1C family serine protease [Methylomirabilota bacterium]
MVLGLNPATHRAIISAITPMVIPQLSGQLLDKKVVARLTAPYNVFQLDAAAYPGDSGSPLYHPDTGQVVGIINKVFVQETEETVIQKPSGISYAIPIIHANELSKKIGLRPPNKIITKRWAQDDESVELSLPGGSAGCLSFPNGRAFPKVCRYECGDRWRRPGQRREKR